MTIEFPAYQVRGFPEEFEDSTITVDVIEDRTIEEDWPEHDLFNWCLDGKPLAPELLKAHEPALEDEAIRHFNLEYSNE